MGARGKMGRGGRSSLVAGVRLKACVFIGLAVHALIYILLIFKFDLYRGAGGGGRALASATILHPKFWGVNKLKPLNFNARN
jgi:hypothetical protein